MTAAASITDPAPTRTVSVIIPVKPGGEVRALGELARATYPTELFEVLVAYGSAPSAQRNQAARQARGEILYFLDDDSRVAPGFLETALLHYRDPRVAAVGGPSLTPATDTPLQQALASIFTSKFGGGGVRNRYRKYGKARCTTDSELILCNLSFRRELFLARGGLDERLYPNEENELMDRLAGEGYLLVHDPELAVYRSQRPTYRAFVRQMYGYGRGRGEQTVLSGVVKGISLAPSLFLVYLALLPLAPHRILALPALGYLAAIAAASLWEGCRARSLARVLRLFYLYPTLHLLYGAGVIRGLIRPRYRARRGQPAPPVEIRPVKEFGAEFRVRQ